MNDAFEYCDHRTFNESIRRQQGVAVFPAMENDGANVNDPGELVRSDDACVTRPNFDARKGAGNSRYTPPPGR